jgi:hypothetical protein
MKICGVSKLLLCRLNAWIYCVSDFSSRKNHCLYKSTHRYLSRLSRFDRCFKLLRHRLVFCLDLYMWLCSGCFYNHHGKWIDGENFQSNVENSDTFTWLLWHRSIPFVYWLQFLPQWLIVFCQHSNIYFRLNSSSILHYMTSTYEND